MELCQVTFLCFGAILSDDAGTKNLSVRLSQSGKTKLRRKQSPGIKTPMISNSIVGDTQASSSQNWGKIASCCLVSKPIWYCFSLVLFYSNCPKSLRTEEAFGLTCSERKKAGSLDTSNNAFLFVTCNAYGMPMVFYWKKMWALTLLKVFSLLRFFRPFFFMSRFRSWSCCPFPALR